jgi:hypothetical protein
VQVPDGFLRRECASERITLPAPGRYGVGMVFLPTEKADQDACVAIVEKVVADEGQVLLGWRRVPVDPAAPGTAGADRHAGRPPGLRRRGGGRRGSGRARAEALRDPEAHRAGGPDVRARALGALLPP